MKPCTCGRTDGFHQLGECELGNDLLARVDADPPAEACDYLDAALKEMVVAEPDDSTWPPRGAVRCKHCAWRAPNMRAFVAQSYWDEDQERYSAHGGLDWHEERTADPPCAEWDRLSETYAFLCGDSTEAGGPQ